MADDVIWIVTDEPVQGGLPGGDREGAVRGNPFHSPTEPGQPNRIAVRAEQLEQGVTAFLQVMGRVLRQAKQNAVELGEMELDEIELSVEVNGEGQLSLLGNGGKMGGKGAMKLKFKMNKSIPPA
jgi:hypothetical protein